ncbi:ABC transporter ATP-binding protein [Natronobiforma cellulositropha]
MSGDGAASTGEPTLNEKFHALVRVAKYRPKQAALILALSMVAALFEGIGVSFIVPIIEIAQADGEVAEEATGVVAYFVSLYQFVGVELTLETLVGGLALVMVIRYLTNFLVAWLQASLSTNYLGELRQQAYDRLLAAEIAYVDAEDTDQVTNTVITETVQSAHVITQLLKLLEVVFFAAIYITVALLLSPTLTVATVVVLGVIAVLSRVALRAGYEIGEEVAQANERIQGLVNAGTRGIREVKLFNMTDDVSGEYRRTIDRFVRTRIGLQRNQAALKNVNQLLNALVVFALIYVALAHLSLSFAYLGGFLFAMFRLAPLVSTLNNLLYGIDGALPHLVRTQHLIDEMERHEESSGERAAPNPITELAVDDASFHYASGNGVRNVSLRVERGETVALVGPSGAGKSTIISLLTRLYDPDEGSVRANGVSLSELGLESWHDRVAIVRQHPFLFNETLRYNVTIGNREASETDIRRACEVSQVSAFLEELPDGLETRVGDDGVRLSGGQRQRVAIARALLTDADVLILDEATSELDSPTEEAIVRGIEGLEREYATVVIGHWLSTVQGADRLYVVAEGAVVESGSHEELLAAGGEYARLYDAQMESVTVP